MNKKLLVSAVSAATLVAGSVNAAVPTEIGTSITALQADAIELLGLAGAGGVAVLAVGLVWGLGMSIVPRFLKRGAKG